MVATGREFVPRKASLRAWSPKQPEGRDNRSSGFYQAALKYLWVNFEPRDLARQYALA